jgi:hypothetical protein
VNDTRVPADTRTSQLPSRQAEVFRPSAAVIGCAVSGGPAVVAGAEGLVVVAGGGVAVGGVDDVAVTGGDAVTGRAAGGSVPQPASRTSPAATQGDSTDVVFTAPIFRFAAGTGPR